MYRIFFILLIFVSVSFAITPKEIQEAYHRSFNYEKISDFDNAIRTLLPVLEAYPKGYTVNLRLGWLYYNNSNLANSIYHYKQAMKVAPSSIEAKLGYLYPLIKQEKYSEVESVCYQIINSDYYNYFGNLKLAYVLRMQKKNELALRVTQKMLMIYPIDIDFLTEFGLVNEAMGEEQTATYTFWDILTLDPENLAAKNYYSRLNNKSNQ